MQVFAQILPKQAFKYTSFFKIPKWPNHFISGKPFQKRPNGNHGSNYLKNDIEVIFNQY